VPLHRKAELIGEFLDRQGVPFIGRSKASIGSGVRFFHPRKELSMTNIEKVILPLSHLNSPDRIIQLWRHMLQMLRR